MNEPTILLPPGLMGRKRHYALDAEWARHTDLAFARTLCGETLLTPAGWAEYRLTPDMFPEVCKRCERRHTAGETSANTAGDRRVAVGHDAPVGNEGDQ